MKKAIIPAVLLSVLLSTSVYAAMPTGVSVGNNNISDSDLKHEKNVAYEGKACLYVRCGSPYTSNRYMQIHFSQDSMSSSKKYRLSYYVKGKDGGGAWCIWRWGWTDVAKLQTSCPDWTYVSYDFTPPSDGTGLTLFVDSQCNYYLDNLSVKELDGDGLETGDNLIIYGDFESGDFEPCSDVSDVSVSPVDGGVEFTWKNPTDDDFKRVDFYKYDKETGDEVFLKSVTPEKDGAGFEAYTTATIDGLENEKIYYFKIYAIDSGDNLPAGVEAYGMPIRDEYYVKDFKATLADDEITALSGGEVSVSAKFSNNKGEDKVVRLISVLKKGNKPIAVKAEEKTVAVGEEESFGNTISVPENTEGLTLQSFIWDGDGNILRNSLILTDEEV